VAQPVHSTCFLTAKTPTTAASYIVPTGFVAVLLTMTFCVGADEPNPIDDPGWYVAVDDPVGYVWTEESNGLTKGAYQWSGREVFYNLLSFATVVGPYFFRANGYLLTLP
jgi:hypothetical protein